MTQIASPESGGQSAVGGPTSSPSGSSPRLDPYVGQTLEGRYLVERPLGEGGMGVVYGGRHKLIDKRVAIKVLRADMAADQEMTERFLNEAKAASSIGHPNIVDISDFGVLPDGAAFFVMEFLDGKSLGALMSDSGVIAIPRLIHIAKQIGRGLSAAHAAGIVHRDLKPDNVMLVSRGSDRDFAKVLDFGIAKVAGEAGKLTRAGSVFGTPHYMSPEQAAGVPVDHRTDIYSLGVILYEMAAGKVPFDADNFMGILTQHMYKSPAPIRAIVPQPQEIPAGLEAIVLKCLSKKVELRYQSMDELVADLERVEQGLPPGAVQEMMARSGGFNVPADYFRNPQRVPGGPAMMPGTPQLARRKPVLLGALVGVGIAVIVVGGGIAYSLRASAGNDGAGGERPFATATADPTPMTSETGAQPVVAPPAKVALVIATDPADAVVSIDDDKARPQPRTASIGPQDHVTLRVEAKGYRTKTLNIDGSTVDPHDPRLVVKLEPIAKAASAPAVTKATAKPVVTPTAPPPPTTCSAEDRDPFTGKCQTRR